MTQVLNLESIGKAKRIALFGGLYSNYLALESALENAQECQVDEIFCLGDLGAFGPHPDRVFPLLIQGSVTTLKGNYDDSIARGLDDCQCGYTDPRDNHFARLSYRYTFSNTSTANREWLGALPDMIRFRFAGRKVLLCHGSPRRMNEFLWESTTPDHFLEKIFDDFDADIIAATHTGLTWIRSLPSGRIFVNAGVLGRPGNDGRSEVWYALLERTEDAGPTVRVRFIPITYDHQRLAREMRTERLPEEFIATIETGWWTTCLEVLPSKERLRGKW